MTPCSRCGEGGSRVEACRGVCKARDNPVEALVFTDPAGRLLFCGLTLSGSLPNLTQACQANLVELLAVMPGITLLPDTGYQGLSAQTAGAVLTWRPARRKNQLPVPPALAAAHEAARQTHACSGSASSTASAI
ncbi:hypothetical protein SAMN05660350_02714 [Geodermatophilus obscurus]|uniref:DDE superfamily endonuclease n=1 Tax=Geodermatophilus obscurus TaxID=1861 RepID=A0A1M7U7N4_9ACTN|nr:hypothetical protein [Geodermatophilus obscurus]SHN78925.1 hypothetical protein SAMN05660350_02714 [Geodermatophilus obscurus]